MKVEPRGEQDVFLGPHEYHDEQRLVYRIYGRDIHELLRRIGFAVAYLEFSRRTYAFSRQFAFL